MLNHRVTVPPDELLEQGFDAVYLACGFQRDARLNIPGIDGEGVFTALRFLEQVARGREARTWATRCWSSAAATRPWTPRAPPSGSPASPATIVYRRTLAEMPAETEELEGLFERATS